jgi:hypothetical protein
MYKFTKLSNHKEIEYLHQYIMCFSEIRRTGQGENKTNVDKIANFEFERTPNGKR